MLRHEASHKSNEASQNPHEEFHNLQNDSHNPNQIFESTRPKELFFIRHGETDYNLKGIVQGRKVNASLNDKGRWQSALFYSRFKNFGFEKIFTSSLKRTVETVQSFIDDEVPFQQLDGLDEIDWGNMEGKIPDDSSRTIFETTLNRWKNGELDHGMFGGESPNELHIRQANAMLTIMQSSEQKILICMHGRALRLLLCFLIQKDFCEMDDFPHQNVSLYHLRFMDNQFKIIAFNDTQHLNEPH